MALHPFTHGLIAIVGVRRVHLSVANHEKNLNGRIFPAPVRPRTDAKVCWASRHRNHQFDDLLSCSIP